MRWTGARHMRWGWAVVGVLAVVVGWRLQTVTYRHLPGSPAPAVEDQAAPFPESHHTQTQRLVETQGACTATRAIAPGAGARRRCSERGLDEAGRPQRVRR
jgi:hypothetical protein